jgi:hypothetical protein
MSIGVTSHKTIAAAGCAERYVKSCSCRGLLSRSPPGCVLLCFRLTRNKVWQFSRKSTHQLHGVKQLPARFSLRSDLFRGSIGLAVNSAIYPDFLRFLSLKCRHVPFSLGLYCSLPLHDDVLSNLSFGAGKLTCIHKPCNRSPFHQLQ